MEYHGYMDYISMFVATLMILGTLATGVIYNLMKLTIVLSILIFIAAWILHFGSKSRN